MTPKTVLSVEEFAALPDDMNHDLNEGELVVTPLPKPPDRDSHIRQNHPHS